MNPPPRPASRTPYSAVRASFLSALVRRYEASGRSAQPVLNRMGISLVQLSDPYGAIPLPQFVGFLEDAARTVGDPLLGARIGAKLTAGDMGPVGIMLSLSESISLGVSRFVSYTNGLQGGTQSRWIPDGSRMLLSYRLTNDAVWPRRQDAEFSLVSLIQVVRDNFGARWSPEEVHFEHSAPPDPAFLERFFRAPVRFDQPINRLIVDRESCSKVVRKEDRDLIATLERHVRDLIGAAETELGIRQSVAAVIEANLGLNPVTVGRVAQALALSPRTLQRQLAEDGTSLRALLDGTRRDRAARMLAQRGITVARVAEALGYTDPTAFWRAHRAWTGHAPSQAAGRGPRG